MRISRCVAGRDSGAPPWPNTVTIPVCFLCCSDWLRLNSTDWRTFQIQRSKSKQQTLTLVGGAQKTLDPTFPTMQLNPRKSLDINIVIFWASAASAFPVQESSFLCYFGLFNFAELLHSQNKLSITRGKKHWQNIIGENQRRKRICISLCNFEKSIEFLNST